MLSGWVLGGVFVVGIGCWYLLKKRNREFALASIKIGAIFGLVASLLSVWTGDGSGYQIAQTQPMKLAAVEGLYEGGTNVGLVGIGMLNPEKKTYNDGKEPFLFRIEIPSMLSFLAERDANAYVPGITNIIEGGYQQKDGTIALSLPKRLNGVKRLSVRWLLTVLRRVPGTRRMRKWHTKCCRRIFLISDTDILRM